MVNIEHNSIFCAFRRKRCKDIFLSSFCKIYILILLLALMQCNKQSEKAWSKF